MRTIYLVTHPEAAHHTAGLVGGWFDSEPTERGLFHSGQVAAELARRIPPDARPRVYSSNLRRAALPAGIVAERLGVSAVLDARLREKSYGEAEGRPQAWLDARFMPPPAAGNRLEHHEGIPGAETRGQLAARIYPAFADIVAVGGGHSVVLTHGFAATMVIAAWIGMPIETTGHVSFRLTPGSISELREDDFYGNRQVFSLNETAHLS